ncbi:MAG: hypothetical protein AAGK05_05915, partial [Pseudomonadota bacterium]
MKASTKRQILSSIASQFDLFGFNGPILNRSRLFLHDLQCQMNIGWDDHLSKELLQEWQNIVKQANLSPEISVSRFVGKRNGSFKLIAFSDSSKHIFGVVIYILDTETNKVSFVLAKNRIVNKQLQNKSIPSLELNGIELATECLIDLYMELSGPSCLNPINIVGLEIYSDSLVSLSWLNSYTNKLSKMQKRSVFVLNRIHRINSLCDSHPIRFSFISGIENPADAMTRCLSYRKLAQTEFYSGPSFLRDSQYDSYMDESLSFFVPNPVAASMGHELDSVSAVSLVGGKCAEGLGRLEHLVLPNKFSSFKKLVSVHSLVLKFIQILKSKVNSGELDKPHSFDSNGNFFARACKVIILRDQHEHFSEIFEYFHSKDRLKKDLPNLIGQLNLFVDIDGILRVRSKCQNMKANRYSFPILLDKRSNLTRLIILDLHQKTAHAGCYSLLAEMRRNFYVPHFFSVVRRILRECVGCRRFKERTIKLNQSPYREWRINPPNTPYKYIFMDYLGPFWVKQQGKKVKVWVLCVTCMWCRAINLKLCENLSVKEFLRAFQLHIFNFGLPEYCISDLGSQFVSASNLIVDYLKDHETQSYFNENGVKSIKFDQFVKGHSELGSMVEICVKFVKRLMYGSVGNNVLEKKDFDFLVEQTIHLVNRRPVAFKEALRDLVDKVPEPITPENLIHGYNLTSVNVIPESHANVEDNWEPGVDYASNVRMEYEKLAKVRKNLVRVYQDEFMGNLIQQATNAKDRYRKVQHNKIKPGDIVLLKEQYVKPNHYPLGLVKEIFENSLGEVTGAKIFKGSSKELVQRHSSVII